MSWNYGDILDRLGERVPADRPCLIHGERTISWGEFTERSNNLARNLLSEGVAVGDKVAFYMRNSHAYTESLGACFKARLTHVNVNYRYVDDELWYILDNSDAKVVVYGREFASHVLALKDRLPEVVRWVEVGDLNAAGTAEVPFAEDYESLAVSGDGAPLEIQRSGDDLLLLYTGGTTGMPKGVMWPHEGNWMAMGAGALQSPELIPPGTIDQHIDNCLATGNYRITVPCCPLMHGTGLFNGIGTLAAGGCIVTLTHPSFDSIELFETVAQHRVNTLAIVGDAFAKPMLKVLDENPGRYDVSSLNSIRSSGVMWSPEVKEGLIRHNPELTLMDSFGASEGVGFGSSVTTADGNSKVARFQIGPNCKVFTEDFREVKPGSDEPGFVAQTGPIPIGYYKDEAKTAKTFPVIDGIRYSMPGDYCKVAEDGTLVLMGRGSVCINTAGEKVYPEEVEEVLKTYPGIVDALVVGVPDDKWGQMVTAVVQPEGETGLDEEAVRAHAREHLAGYKTPKRVFVKADLQRASNGKADYKAITAFARESLGIAT
jgi:fatty-acyl-CoA synthase